MIAQKSIDVDSTPLNKLLPTFFSQSFNISPITSESDNSIGVCYTGEGKVVFISDRQILTLPSVNNRYRAFVFDMSSQTTKRLDTRNLCDINNNNYNIAGLTVNDSNTFMIVAVNDYRSNEYLAESRIILTHVDLSYGFSQCATPPFVQLGYTYTQPFFDSNEDYLYFASDVDGGMGGLDIYRVKLLASNLWGEIEPMTDINTINNDVYPFVDNDGRLYYSTLTGKNGFDVFCWYENLSRPIRLPSPINSRLDDLNYVQIGGKDAFITRTTGDSQSAVIYRLLAF
tara:strand:- start:1982 stop:2836 length:855 start_codon:yes stop_codon:yes gene_type:complete